MSHTALLTPSEPDTQESGLTPDKGLWVFDDARVGLVQEPFAGGADTLIDVLVADIPDAKRGFQMVFSASKFPGPRRNWTGCGPKRAAICTACRRWAGTV